MKIEIAAFTNGGYALGESLRNELIRGGDQVGLTRCTSGGADALREWTQRCFTQADALVFIGAVGIAVRGIAPLLVGKAEDPAVVALDETGRFCVSLLSGHLGGANDLALRVGKITGATPVITTATDRRGVFAVDSWAANAGFFIQNPQVIVRVSAKLLAGEPVSFFSPFPIRGNLPAGVILAENPDLGDILVDIRNVGKADALHIVPPIAVLGLGCRRGTSASRIDWAVKEFCQAHHLAFQAISRVCSVDLKGDEDGLLAYCRDSELPFATFSASELRAVEGQFTPSPFVERTTGVDNVCERSAVLGAGGPLLVGKTIINGISLALAAPEICLEFGVNK